MGEADTMADTMADAMADAMMDATVTLHRSAAPLRERWRALEAEAHGYVFQSHAYVSAILDTVGREGRPAIALVEDRAGAPLMLMPLVVRSRGGMTRLEFIDFGLADYNAPLIRKDIAANLDGEGFRDVWRRILRAAGPIDAVSLKKVPDRLGPITNPLLHLFPLSGRPQADSFQAPLSGDYEAFLKTRSKSLVSDTRRKRRRLDREGRVEFRVAGDAAEVERIMDAILVQKSHRFRAIGTVDQFRDPAFAAFYRRLARDEWQGGGAHVSALTVDGTIAAAHFGMVFGDRFYWLMPAFDETRFGRCSPGRLLMHELLRWAFDRKLAVFDFTIGDERYKLDWAERTMPLYGGLQSLSFRGSVYGSIHTGVESMHRGTQRIVKERFPSLYTALKGLRAKAANRGASPLNVQGDSPPLDGE